MPDFFSVGQHTDSDSGLPHGPQVTAGAQDSKTILNAGPVGAVLLYSQTKGGAWSTLAQGESVVVTHPTYLGSEDGDTNVIVY